MSEAMDRSADELAPINKAAILLLAMGEDEAAKALNHIEPRQVQRVGAAMAALGGVDTRQVDSVVSHFLETISGDSDAGMGASDYFKQMLSGTPARRRSSSLVQRLFGGSRPALGRLRWMDSSATAGYLRQQRPRFQAIMLAYLEPERAAEVLLKLADASARSRALLHLARLDSSVARSAGLPGGQAGVLGGRRMAAAILACLDDVASAAVMAGIRRADQALAEDIEAAQTRRRRGAAGPARAGRHEDPAVSESQRFARFHTRINETLDAQDAWLRRLTPALADRPASGRSTGTAPGPLAMLENPSADSAA